MTSLDLGGAGKPKVDVQVGIRRGWLKHIGVAIGGATGASIALGGYEVFRAQPDRSFTLLQTFGPLFLVALMVLYVGGKVLEGMVAAVRESFSMVATSVHDSAEASARTADALTRLADQGGREAEQVERLAIYAGQEFPCVYERLDAQDAVLSQVVMGIKGLHSMLSKEKAALDLKESETGERNGG